MRRARSHLLKNPDLMLLDELANHLDIATKEMLIRALGAYEGTMLFVSHDRHFLAALSNRVLELTPDGVNQYGGGIRNMSRAPGWMRRGCVDRGYVDGT